MKLTPEEKMWVVLYFAVTIILVIDIFVWTKG